MQRFKIKEFNAELTEQIRILHQLVSEIERDNEQRRWQFLGTILAFISALQVLSLFSDETRHHWWQMLVAWLFD